VLEPGHAGFTGHVSEPDAGRRIRRSGRDLASRREGGLR
jgi:hypothetical protein